jgi:spermidine synthase
MLVGGFFIAKPLVLHGEQKKYQDKIVYSEQTPYQRIIITQWKDDYWLYLNGNQQLCTRDEVMYHEPLVHPAMRLHPYPQNVLVLGGGDGCAVREVLKYPSVELVHLVDMDKAMTDLGKEHPVLKEINNNSLHHDKVKIINDDAYTWVNNSDMHYDVIIIDLPDPRSVELGRLYTFEFYRTCYRMLRPHGIVVTQAGSPYFATRAFLCVEKTMKKAGFNTAPIHNQVVTMGEWGWIIGQKSKTGNDDVVERLKNLHFKDIDTKWINNEAMGLITSFGKDIYLWDKKEVEINRIHHPVLYKYYLKGNWDLY